MNEPVGSVKVLQLSQQFVKISNILDSCCVNEPLVLCNAQNFESSMRIVFSENRF